MSIQYSGSASSVNPLDRNTPKRQKTILVRNSNYFTPEITCEYALDSQGKKFRIAFSPKKSAELILSVAKKALSKPLVQSRISQNDYYFSFYPKDLQIRPFKVNTGQVPDAIRGNISGFSRNSQRRLSFVARNSGDILTSQFCLTYHEKNPDGSESKSHLNTFLTNIRQNRPFLKYLWIMEFQKRGVVHYHLFLNLSITPRNRRLLAVTWKRVTKESKKHLKFHLSIQNFIKWKMNSGGYLTKYLQKIEQKGVPSDFENCGRFWGNSRGLVPPPTFVTMDELAQFMGKLNQVEIKYIQKKIRRIMLKCYEKTLSNYSKRKRNLRKYQNNILIPFGRINLEKLMSYFCQGIAFSPPPF